MNNDNKFRNDLINKNEKFKNLFTTMLRNGEISEYSEELWKIILKDKTPIRINFEPFAFKDLFHLNLNEGRCRECAFEMVLLLDKLGIYSEAVECINEFLIGTPGSTYGGHYYVEAKLNNKIICIDTSLIITGSTKAFTKLGYKIVKKYDIDTIFKQDPHYIDYYDEMIISKL